MTREDALRILESKGFKEKLRADYNSAIKALKNPGQKIRCGKTSGSGRYSTSVSWVRDVVFIFNRLGFEDFEVGNDAPRQGRVGDFIIVK